MSSAPHDSRSNKSLWLTCVFKYYLKSISLCQSMTGINTSVCPESPAVYSRTNVKLVLDNGIAFMFLLNRLCGIT